MDDGKDLSLSRQAFVKKGLGQLAGMVANAIPTVPEEKTTAQKNPLRPPGALSEEVFTQACDPTCSACAEACPKVAIIKDERGFPFITPEQSPCVMCVDVPCTHVCPTEALTPLTHPTDIAMGTAVIDATVCTAFQGSGCTACYHACPIPSEAIQLAENLPQIIEKACTGCGVCVHACPTSGSVHVFPHS